MCVLTPSTVESAYKHVNGIYCCCLQGGSEWCKLWSVYVGMFIASETHVICRPWRWRLYIPPKLWCPSTVLQGVTVYKTGSLTTCMNEISRNFGKYFKAAPQITLHTLHRNLIMVLPFNTLTNVLAASVSCYQIQPSDQHSNFCKPSYPTGCSSYAPECILCVNFLGNIFIPATSTYSLSVSVVVYWFKWSHWTTHTHSVGLPWTRDRPVAEASTYTTRRSQETFIHAAGSIRTRNPSKRAALGSASNGFGS